MALHTDLPIYRTGVQLLSLAFKVQEQMPRGVKRSLGDKISQHCVEMLDLMALANATQRAERAEHIHRLMTHQRAATVLLRIEHMPAADTHATGNSYLGLVRQATHSHKERAALCRALMKRGHAVEGQGLTKIFRNGATT